VEVQRRDRGSVLRDCNHVMCGSSSKPADEDPRPKAAGRVVAIFEDSLHAIPEGEDRYLIDRLEERVIVVV